MMNIYDKKTREDSSFVSVSTPIRGTKESIYSLLKNMEQFPQFIHDIKSIKVTKKMDNTFITEWNITIEGANIVWLERDTFNNKEMHVKFKMLHGDFNAYEGEWLLKDERHKIVLCLSAHIDWGAPAFLKFIKPVIEKKAKKAFKTFLLAIKKEVERKR
jgi:coenzyme Q-binding protein COQ10